MTKLTEKQKRFVQEYLIDLNATQAAIRAGYSEKSAGRQAVELLNKTHISTAIQKAMKNREDRTEITQDKVLNQLAKYAFSDIRDIMTWNDETGRIHLRSPEEIDGSLITELTQTVTEVPYGDDMADKITTKIKRGDPLKALQLLGQHLGMFDPKTNVSIEKTKAEIEFIKERTKLIKGEKKDTSLLEALIDTVNDND